MINSCLNISQATNAMFFSGVHLQDRVLNASDCCHVSEWNHGLEPSASKRLRRPTCPAIILSSDCKISCRKLESQKYEKKRPTLRFSEMIRHDWTTFSREKAEYFDAVELAVYSPWRQVALESSQLDQFGVNVDAVHGVNIAVVATKPRKSSWYAADALLSVFY